MENDAFDEKSLKDALYAAALMSFIDAEFHADEWAVINDFADGHWKKNYGNFEEHKDQIKKEIQYIVSTKTNLQKRINVIVEELTAELNSHQKNVVLNLVGDVMAADGVMTLEESKLFATFMDKMGIRLY